MKKFEPVEYLEANEIQKAALDQVQAVFGGTPNLLKMLANAPGILQGYLKFNDALTSASLSPALVEQIALTVSGSNACEYCVAVHVMIGGQFGITRKELLANIEGKADDPKTKVMLCLAKDLVENRGKVSDQVIQNVRNQGISDTLILEILGVVGIYTFLNYLNHLTKPVLDFPKVGEFRPLPSDD